MTIYKPIILLIHFLTINISHFSHNILIINIQHQQLQMIQQTSNTSQFRTQHLKEYTCCIFDKLLTAKYQPDKKMRVTFPYTQPNKNLPHYYHDKISDQIYLLKWVERGLNLRLQIVVIATDRNQNQLIYVVEFDNHPEHLAFVYGYMYFIGGGTIYIFSMDLSRTDTIIQRIQYATIQTLSGVLEDNQSSLIIYCRDHKDKLFTRQITPNSYNRDGGGWFSKLSLNAIKSLFVQSSANLINFKLLVGKVVGITIHNENSFSLVNLNTFQTIPNTHTTLTGWTITNPKSVIVHLNQIKPKHGYDDSIMFCLADSIYVQFFILNISLHTNVEIQPNTKYSLTMFPNEEIINWERCSLQSYLTIRHSQQILLDLQFVNGGFIICGLKSIYSQFPNYNFYLFNEYNVDGYMILAEELPLWERYHHEHKKVKDKQLLNKMLMANTYPVSFITYMYGVEKIEHINYKQLNWKKTIFLWAETFKFVKIIMLKGKILILREHSLSVLLPISPEQYHWNHNTYLKFQIIIENTSNFNLEENISETLSNISLEIPLDTSPLIVSHQYNKIDSETEKNKLKQMLTILYNSIFKSYDVTQQPMSSITQIHNLKTANQHSLRLPHYRTILLTNRIRDVLTFYTTYVLSLISKLECSDQQLSDINKYFKPFAAALQFYHYLLTQGLANQYNTFGKDIISNFVIEKLSSSASQQIDRDVYYGVGMLLNGLIPRKHQNNYQFQHCGYNNMFLEMLIIYYNLEYKDYQEEVIKKFFAIFQYQDYIPLTPSVIGILGIMDESTIRKIFIRYVLMQRPKFNLIPILRVQSSTADSIFKEILAFYCPEMLQKSLQYANIDIFMQQNPSIRNIIKKNIKTIVIPTFEQLKSKINDNFDNLVNKTVQKLKFIEDYHKLLQFQGVVFKARCIIFQNEIFKYQDRDSIISAYTKCLNSLTDYIQYYQGIYKSKISNENHLFGSKYLIGNVKVINRYPTTKWLEFIWKFITRCENLKDLKREQIEDIICYSLIGESFIKNDLQLMQQVIEFFGCSKIQSLIKNNKRIKQEYRKVIPEIKVLLQYCKINFQGNEKGEKEILRQMKYRNAFIEANLIN